MNCSVAPTTRRRNRPDVPSPPLSAGEGSRFACELDPDTDPKGIKVSDEEMANLNITRDKFHPEWNYVIAPRIQNMERWLLGES